MAKRRLRDEADPLQAVREYTDLLAESERSRRPVLLFSACATYCRVLPWFEAGYVGARANETEFPGPEVLALLDRAGTEWQSLTGLPPLSDDVDAWHEAAKWAGIAGRDTLADIESGEQEAMNYVCRNIVARAGTLKPKPAPPTLEFLIGQLTPRCAKLLGILRRQSPMTLGQLAREGWPERDGGVEEGNARRQVNRLITALSDAGWPNLVHIDDGTVHYSKPDGPQT